MTSAPARVYRGMTAGGNCDSDFPTRTVEPVQDTGVGSRVLGVLMAEGAPSPVEKHGLVTPTWPRAPSAPSGSECRGL
jgi:hypothetical protein